jgi:hypothetical protein
MESAIRRANNSSNFKLPDTPKVITFSNDMAKMIMTKGKPAHLFYDEPARWANRSYIQQAFEKGDMIKTDIRSLYTLSGDDPFYLYSLGEDKRLRGEPPFN